MWCLTEVVLKNCTCQIGRVFAHDQPDMRSSNFHNQRNVGAERASIQPHQSPTEHCVSLTQEVLAVLVGSKSSMTAVLGLSGMLLPSMNIVAWQHKSKVSNCEGKVIFLYVYLF